MKNIVKILTALATIAGAVYIVATYGEQIVAWCKQIWAKMPKCPGCEEAEIVEAEEAEDAPEEEATPEAAAEAVPWSCRSKVPAHGSCRHWKRACICPVSDDTSCI